VFYVTDLTGTKVSHPSRQAAIRRALLDVFEGEDGGQAAAG
jgi:[protein-PII] uridylyltransferase